MATYNNQHWLLSHIRNSFISTDDTGMCECVMLSEDLPSQLAHYFHRTQKKNGHEKDEFNCYPGLVDQSDDEDAFSQSYDIQMDPDVGLHRQRSNTFIKLEKMDMARRKAAKIKKIKCDDNNVTNNQDTNTNNLFIRKECGLPSSSAKSVTSLLSEQLQQCPKQPQNKFLEYAKFDGTAQTGIPTKTLKIFLTMLPVEFRRYPMAVYVIATAKIQELIGLICYQCSIAYPDLPLLSVKNYGLFITEEDGEVDIDFPALDLREPCSKFCFSHLALVERKEIEFPLRSMDDRTLSLTSESEMLLILAEVKAKKEQQTEDLARMLGHTTMMEAPLYQTYRLYIIHKSLFKTEIQLGISGEKIEIDPVQQKNSKFFRQKAVSHSMESIACCELIEEKSSRAIFRIVYSTTGNNSTQTQSTSTTTSEYSPMQQSAINFKNYDFETNPTNAHEIVKKINNILEVRSVPSRREYLASKEKRKTLQNRKQKHPFKL